MSTSARSRAWSLAALAFMWIGVIVGGSMGFAEARTTAEVFAFTALCGLLGGVAGIVTIVAVFVAVVLTLAAASLFRR